MPDAKSPGLDVLDDLKPSAATFDAAKAHAGPSIKHERQLIRARFSPDGKHIAAAGLDKLIHVWDFATEKKHTLPGHGTWVSALLFHPGGKHLFTADYHGTIHCWDYATPDSKPRFTIAGADKQITRILVVSADGQHLFSGGDDAVVRVWDAATGKRVKDFPGHAGCIFSLALHPDGKSLVSGDLFGVIKHWDLATGKLTRELDAKLLHTRKEDFIADVGGVRCLAFDLKGAVLACGGMANAESNAFCPGTPAALLFDWASGKSTLQLKLAGKSDGPINALRYLPDGTLAGLAEHQGTATELAFWKGDKPEPFHTVKESPGYDLDLHPDGLRLLAPLFVSMGSGGNGARAKFKDKYVQNASLLRVFNLFAAAPAKKPVKKG